MQSTCTCIHLTAINHCVEYATTRLQSRTKEDHTCDVQHATAGVEARHAERVHQPAAQHDGALPLGRLPRGVCEPGLGSGLGTCGAPAW